ncbi:MAG: hypothetical protein KF795_29470 [Labilithrix sp.]|nr:hypothetical protein [Labilithrix sp.]
MRASRVLGLAAIALAQACTYFSGVEELELGDRHAAADASVEGSAPGADAPPTFGLGGDDAGADRAPAAAQCGAQGTWTSCETADTFATCAERCQAKGASCVESCCAYDELGDFAAKAGMVYATPGLTCDLGSVPSTSSSGLCNDPVLPLGAGVMDVRCCCR